MKEVLISLAISICFLQRVQSAVILKDSISIKWPPGKANDGHEAAPWLRFKMTTLRIPYGDKTNPNKPMHNLSSTMAPKLASLQKEAVIRHKDNLIWISYPIVGSVFFVVIVSAIVAVLYRKHKMNKFAEVVKKKNIINPLFDYFH